MNTSIGYMKISKFLRSFVGSKQQTANTQSVGEVACVSGTVVQAPVKCQIQRPRLKSTSAANELGDFKSSEHPSGINLRGMTAAAPQPAQLGKDAPLNAVFSRLLAQQTPVTSIPEQNLRSMLGLIK